MPYIKDCHVCRMPKDHKSWKAYTCNDCLDKGLKWCPSCESIHYLSNFHKNGVTIRSFCKKCEIQRCRDSKVTKEPVIKPDTRIARNLQSSLCKKRRYHANEENRLAEISRCHSRRASMEGSVSSAEWLNCLSTFGCSCAYCGATTSLTQDHVVPISKNGLHHILNIVPSCQSCNSSKCAKGMVEWYTSTTFFSSSKLEKILSYMKNGGDAHA